jgi:capsular exopolysaccharide synthesis family protein
LGSRSEILPKSIEKIVHTNTKSIISEAYGALRTSILLSSANSPPKTILVTSSQPEEGKTATAINIAITLAQLGEKVLLLDTDLRRPKIAKIFKIFNKFGISNFLAGNTDDRKTIFSTEIPNLFIIPSGPIPPNPAVLLTTAKLDNLLEDWKKSFSFIIMDSPPILSVTDAQLLASKVDAVMIIVHGGMTPRDLVKLCKERLRGSNIIGVVLNRINLDKHDYYYKHYYNYYSKKSRMHDKKLAIRIGNKR